VGYVWHEIQARTSLEEAIGARGLHEVYALVDLARQALWCRDASCRHKTEVPVIGQTFGDEGVEQLWCRARIAGLIGSQRVIQVPIVRIGAAGPDRDCDGNRQQLLAALDPGVFAVDVWSSVGGVDDDGRVSWSHALPVALEAEDGADELCELQQFSAPLEIGYTLPSRTLAHLVYNGAVWRWPYGAQELWLMAAIEREGCCLRLRPLNYDFVLPERANAG
jgi:hypothetical protein